MDQAKAFPPAPTPAMSRRALLGAAGAGGIALLTRRAWAQSVDLGFSENSGARPLTSDFPQKGTMVLQRTRPPLLETPFEVFDKSVFTPNDQFYVRWHWAVIPTDVDAESFRLNVHGQVDRALSLSLKEIVDRLPRIELAAVNQCSGNSRGYFAPRVSGGEWGNGAMGNARWTGVRLKDVLDMAGVKAGAIQVRFRGLDEPVVSDGPAFLKSLSLDHARDGEVMIAYAMNGEQLPLLNGFPLRLVVPGWYATYWVKMLSDIEVLTQPDDNFWTAKAYKIPDTPGADMMPGEKDVKMVPISRMVPRSFITNLIDGSTLRVGTPAVLRGIAFGGDCGVAKVEISSDGGTNWAEVELGQNEGKYSFRQWEGSFTPPAPGPYRVAVRCTNTQGAVQPDRANWNPGGYMRNIIESVEVIAS